MDLKDRLREIETNHHCCFHRRSPLINPSRLNSWWRAVHSIRSGLMQARQQSRQYLTVCSICDRWQIPIRRKVRSSKPSRATTAFLINRSRHQCAQGVAIKFQHSFHNHRAYASIASLTYDGDMRPSCGILRFTRNASIGNTAFGGTDAPHRTKHSMRYPGTADHDVGGGPSVSAASVTMKRRSRMFELAPPRAGDKRWSLVFNEGAIDILDASVVSAHCMLPVTITDLGDE
ncbi:hypothetical protein ACVWYI_002466 [Bradyrhizobium sp. LB13.1]